MDNSENQSSTICSESESKTFKVLSIDGGGIKGLYSSRILENFEKRFDCHIADYFDLICGTSTGGLIALAISLKLPVRLISNLYQECGSEIFPQQRKTIAFLKQMFWNGKHSNEALRKELNKVFNNALLEESYSLLCIPAFSLNDGRPFIFKFDHDEGNLKRDNRIKYVDIALATSAAPTYLPIVSIENYGNKQFIDGGVYANNPTLIGIAEALKYFVGQNKQFKALKVLSIASLESPPGRLTIKDKKRSFINWNKDLFSVFSEGQAYSTEYFTQTLASHGNTPFDYIRIPSASLSSEQLSIVSMDNASEESLALLSQKGSDQGDIWGVKDEVINFFKEKKHYTLR
ncbi:MAG: CBASS cGAMP-activated phospholipase [Cyanobacteria bacterium J06634_6]